MTETTHWGNHSLGTDLNECLATWQLGTFLSCRQLGTVLASPAGEPANRQRLSPMTSHLRLSPMTTLAGRLWRGPLALSRDQMRAESLLRLELERGEPGFLDERA